MKVTEPILLMHAPNSAAAENGRKLSKKGRFANHCRTADCTLYWAECVGSGKKPYRTSIDFSASDSAPICRCSCPSRQFPCKHALGLLFEMLAEKEFAIAEIPADIADKRAKQAAQAAKREFGDTQLTKPKKTNTEEKTTAAARGTQSGGAHGDRPALCWYFHPLGQLCTVV